MNNLPLVILITLATGGVAWVFLYPILSGERTAEKRKQSVVRTGASIPARASRSSQKPRREQIESSLKELDQRSAKSMSLSVLIWRLLRPIWIGESPPNADGERIDCGADRSRWA